MGPQHVQEGQPRHSGWFFSRAAARAGLSRFAFGCATACGARNDSLGPFITADLKVCSTPVSSDNLGFAGCILADFLLDLKANKW
jgi:hypothetical protein